MDLKRFVEILDNQIVQRTLQQQWKGLQKYGTTVKTTSHNLMEWHEHMQQELTDFLVYNEVMKSKIKDCLDVAKSALNRGPNAYENALKSICVMLGGTDE